MTYDPNNIFARILRAEIPCNKIYEDEFCLAFHDIQPRAKIHVLLIPKGPYISSYDFHKKASSDELTGFYRALSKLVDECNLSAEGYRILSNHGINGGQEVPHYHVHLFGGQALGPMLSI